MKTILMTISLLLGANAAVAQKTVYIVNMCNDVNFYLYGIQTANATGVAYPWCESNPSGGVAVIVPWQTYTLEATAPTNSMAFPFYSPSTSPAFTSWGITTSSAPPTSPTPSLSVGLGQGMNQIIADIKATLRKASTGALYMDVHLHPDATNDYHQEFTFGDTGHLQIDILPTPNGETYVTMWD